MNNNTPNATIISDALKTVANILDKIAEEAHDVEFCGVSYNDVTIYPIKTEVHVFLGIEAIAGLYNCPVEVAARNDDEYPRSKETIIDGVKFFELVSAAKGNI